MPKSRDLEGGGDKCFPGCPAYASHPYTDTVPTKSPHRASLIEIFCTGSELYWEITVGIFLTVSEVPEPGGYRKVDNYASGRRIYILIPNIKLHKSNIIKMFYCNMLIISKSIIKMS